jgi:uncharacterized protein (DUF1330 family)
MQENAVLVVVEVVSVEDPAGLKAYAERASKLIGASGGVVLGRGGVPVDGEAGFAPLVIERWPSESAFRAWLDSEAYQSLRKIRLASATMRVAVVPICPGVDAQQDLDLGSPGSEKWDRWLRYGKCSAPIG